MPYLTTRFGDPQEYSLYDLRQAVPNVSFPATPSPSLLAEHDVYSYEMDPEPSYDPSYQSISPGDFYQDGAQWKRRWVVSGGIEEERANMICSRFQAKAALSAAGLLSAAESAVAAADATTQLAWAEAIEFRRNSPTITTMAATLGLTPEQVDDLFRAAMQIEA